MPRRWLVTGLLAAVVVLSPSFAGEKGEKVSRGDGHDVIVELEKKLWMAWEKQDPTPVADLMRDDAKLVGPWGTWEKSAWTKALTDKYCTVRSWSIGDVEVSKIGKGAVLLSYTAEQDATCKDGPVDPRIVVSSIWVKDGNAWRNKLYHEAPLARQ